MSEIQIDPKVDQAIDQLDDQKTFGIALAEFARTIVDRPENYAKIANSFAGHAVHLHNSLVLRELTLWCSRVLEKNGNSLPVVSKKIGALSDKIANARRTAHPDWPEEELQISKLPDRIKVFSDRVETLADSTIVRNLKVVRDEQFAHLLSGISGARRGIAEKDADVSYSYNEVIRVVDQAVQLISEAIFIWRFHSHDDAGTRKSVRKYYEGYWEFLPVFAELESKKREERIKARRSSSPFE